MDAYTGLLAEKKKVSVDYDVFALITHEGSELIFSTFDRDPDYYHCAYRDDSGKDWFTIEKAFVDGLKTGDTIRLPPRFQPYIQTISKIYAPASDI